MTRCVASNYRCVLDTEIQSIHDAVHGDLDQSRKIHHWVGELCRELGAGENDLVPFEKYAAAENLVNPSAAARALAAGAKNIERVDRLVQSLAAGKGRQLDEVDEIVSRVDGWLQRNRQA